MHSQHAHTLLSDESLAGLECQVCKFTAKSFYQFSYRNNLQYEAVPFMQTGPKELTVTQAADSRYLLKTDSLHKYK